MRLAAGFLVGAAAVITIWATWRPTLRWALSRGDEPYHP